MIELFSTAFLLGLLGSMHCVGMCGGLVTTLSMVRQKIWWSGLMSYQMGRIATYSLLGLLAGMVGMVATQLPWFSDMQRVLTFVAGSLMILFGLHLAGWLSDPLIRIMATFSQVIGFSRWIQAASSSRMPMSWFMIGLFNGLLPCGLVYAGLALSIGSGNIATSTGMMLAFGLGTVPAMTLVPWVLKSITPKIRGNILKVAAIFVIALGVLTIIRGGDWMHRMHGSHHTQQTQHDIHSMHHEHSTAP